MHTQLERRPLISYPFKLDSLPKNGIYFFYENGETQNHAASELPRIVRVGTHKEGNFRSRIAEHFFLDEHKMVFDADKPAPHERSIFRKHIGRALLERENDPYLKVWELVFTPRATRDSYGHLRDIRIETEIELEVTRILRDTFTFRYIEILGEKDRMGGDGLEKAPDRYSCSMRLLHLKPRLAGEALAQAENLYWPSLANSTPEGSSADTAAASGHFSCDLKPPKFAVAVSLV
jgi:hypothetical protein